MPEAKEINTEAAESPLSLQERILKSEGLRIGFVVFSGLFALLFFIPLLFNNAALKFQLAQKFSQISGANVVIHGDLKVAFLPSPEITVENVLLQNYKIKKSKTDNEPQEIYNLYAKSIQFKLPISGFSDSVFRKIILTDAVLESHVSSDKVVDRQDKFTAIVAEFVKKSTTEESGKSSSGGISSKLFSVADLDANSFSAANVPDIIIINGETIFYDDLERKKEVKAINAETDISKKHVSSIGSFASEGVVSSFKFLAKFNSQSSSPDSSLEIISPVINLRVAGNITSENHGVLGSDFKGKIEAEIFDLKSFYKSYIGGNSIIANKLKYSTSPIKISADIANESKEIVIQNILINSSLINGKGDVDLSFSDKIPLIDINFDLENLDVDGIWSGDVVSVPVIAEDPNKVPDCVDEMAEVVPQNQDISAVVPAPVEAGDKTVIIAASDPKSLEETTKEAAKEKTDEGAKAADATVDAAKEQKKIEPINFNLTTKIRDFDLTAEIKIKDIKYMGGNIKDANLYLTVSREGEILVLPMIFRIPGDGLVRINGVLDNTTELPKFVGKFDVRGKSLKDIFQWVEIESQNLKFDSLKDYSLYADVLLLPNKTTFDNFYLNLNGGQSEFLGEIHIDNSDKTPVISSQFQVSNFKIDDYFLTSGQNAYLSPGTLLKKLLWLNNISSSGNLALSFDKLVYKDEEFIDQSLKLKIGRGYLEIKDLNLKSDKSNLTANLTIDISDKSPKFDMSIAANKLHYDTAQKIESTFDDPVSQGAVTEDKKIKKQNFFDQFFALPSLEGFRGSVSLTFDDLVIDNLAITNFKMSGKVSDGNIDNSDLSCGIYDGSLSYKGLIGIKINKTINGNLVLSNSSLQPLLSDLVGIENVSGVANISANITAAAGKKEEFLKNLRSEIKFNANAPTVERYGLNDLVKKMFAAASYRSELSDPEQILFNPTNKTIFKQADGTVQIGGGNGEGKVRINATAPAVNGILAGTVNVSNNTANLLFNAIFLTGNRQKQTPINIATNLKGPMNAFDQSTNSDQARQYLGLRKINNATTVINPAQQGVTNANPSTQTPSQQIPTQQVPASAGPTSPLQQIQQQPAPAPTQQPAAAPKPFPIQ